jgi:hypothetical protein
LSHNTKRKRILIKKTWMIYVSLILLLNATGIGYAGWQDDLSIVNIVSTGSIAPVFNEHSIVSEDSKNEVSATATTINGGKEITINLINAYPGYSVTIQYTITNNGTIPIVCKVINKLDSNEGIELVSNINSQEDKKETEDLPIKIEIIQPGEIIGGYGDSRDGLIKITVGEVEKSTMYSLNIGLDFHQFNDLKEYGFSN